MEHIPSEPRSDLPVVVILHGYFSANRVGPARLYVQIARTVYARGFRVLRCDILGVGDSDGEFSDVSFQTTVRDALRICRYALSQTTTELILIGHSMGANVAAIVAQEIPRIALVAMLAPEIAFRGGIDHLFATEQLHELSSRGFTIRKGLHINASFIHAIREAEVIRAARTLAVPIVVIHCADDEFYEPSGSRELVTQCIHGQLILIEGGDHNFLEPQVRVRLLAEISKAIEGYTAHGK